ncbi:MAG: choice-of-anchor L domain-containing protein [Bacteroidota bacterium]
MYKTFSFTVLLTFFCVGVNLLAQDPTPESGLKIKRAVDVDQLVREVFIREGDCARVSNIKAIGRIAGIGSFSTLPGTIAVGIDSGLVISSGEVKDIVGPNNLNNTTGIGTLNSSDPDLALTAESRIFDATGIEFDFIPTSTQVSFNYVFASEEYCEFVNDAFNDVFGFFVSGPGINGRFGDRGINVARIPETDERVSINSVNHLRNKEFFIENLLNVDLVACDLQPTFNTPRDVEFDGMTVRLRATIDVIPCETYHIRLVVGDVTDNILDSGVFLEANSFDLGSSVGITSEVVSSEGNTMYENCLEGNFVFERKTLVNRGRPLVINYQINGNAQNGVDYEPIPRQITIPVGERFARLPIKGILDELDEEEEIIEIVTEIPSCDCIERDTAFLVIADGNSNLEVAFDEELACLEETFSLRPEILNGIPPLVYQWSTGDTASTILATLSEPTSFGITVSDACGTEDSAQVQVDIQDPPTAILDGTTDWCTGQIGQTLPVEMGGNGPWALTYAVNDTQLVRFSGIETNPFAIPVNAAGNYDLIAFNDKNCQGTGQGTGNVNNTGFEINPVVDLPSCQTASDGSILLEFNGGEAPYLINWDSSATNGPELTSLGLGTYQALVVDGRGCIEASEIIIDENLVGALCPFSRRSIYIPNAFSPNGDEINDTFSIFPKGGAFEAVSFQIFDRWGSLMYTSQEFNSFKSLVSWDGSEAPIGVYLCKVLVRLTDGRTRVLYQDVQLVR